MIIEAIFDALLMIPNLIIDLLPKVDFVIPQGVFDSANDIFKGVGYVLPVKALLPIIYTELALDNFKILMAILVRVKSFIPFMGA